MEIVEKGSRNRVKCECCGSLLEYAASDITYRVGTLAYYFIKCPNCGFDIGLSDLVRSVQEMAHSKATS